MRKRLAKFLIGAMARVNHTTRSTSAARYIQRQFSDSGMEREGDFVLQLQRESTTKLRPTNDRRRKLISDNYSNNLQFRDDGVDPFLYSRLRRLEDNDRLSMHRTNISLCFHQMQEPVRISWPQLRLASTEKT